MIYLYQNAAGETREISASMKNPPPEWVTFGPGEAWTQAVANDPLAFTRVYGDVQVDAGTVRSKYPFASSTLPHGLPGCRTDRHGRTIVESKAHEDRICKEHGYVKGW